MLGFVLKAIGICLIAVWFYQAFSAIVHNQKVIAEALDKIAEKLETGDNEGNKE